MNVPNLITVIRIILTPVLVICLIQSLYCKAFIVFIVASLTDALDGFLARVLHQKSVLGAYLDPLADKALITSAFLTLSILSILPAWLTVIVISRDLVIITGIVILSLMSVPYEIKPAIVSKFTTAFQFLTIIFALLSMIAPSQFEREHIAIIFWATAILTVISGLNYITRGIRFINGTSKN